MQTAGCFGSAGTSADAPAALASGRTAPAQLSRLHAQSKRPADMGLEDQQRSIKKALLSTGPAVEFVFEN